MVKKRNKSKSYQDEEDEGKVNMVSEPAAAYFTSHNHFNSILSYASKKPESQLSAFEKMHIVRDGVS
ncbi:MAG TPA: hypothetical protein VFI29_13250, partial [Hanamia sp.]|nr:hypothetical protein [Hanamia sp.]